MKPMFSVIVPIYKVEDYLKKCIDSILSQTYKNFELILVDDGSPDNCPKICDQYAKKDKRVVVIHKPNGGLVSARNAGLKAAKGEYICYVDGDDWVSKDLLQTIFDKAINSNNCDIVIYNAVKKYADKEVLIPYDLKEGYYTKNMLREDIYPYMMYDSRKPFCTGLIFPVAWNKVYRAKLLKGHYCKDERIRMGEDNAFVFECLYVADNVYICSDVLYYYNQLNTGSITSNYDINRFENNQYLNTYIEEHLKGANPTIDSQINAFKTYWLIMAIFHEIKCKRKFLESRRHIKKEIKKTKVLSDIKYHGLPLFAKCYLTLLKLHLYTLALIGANVMVKIRKS